MINLELSVVSTLLAVFALWVCGLFVAAMGRSRKLRRREQFSQEIRPRMREALVEFMAGNEDRPRFREFMKQSRGDLEEAFFGFRGAVSGGARDRLCELTIELALLHDWCQDAQSRDVIRRRAAFEKLAFVCVYEPCLRIAGDLLGPAMEDSDSEVRLSAARGLLDTGLRRAAERVFRMALSSDLLTRILLSEDLRRYSPMLCERAFPQLLASEDQDAIGAGLDMAIAWQRALPLDLSGVMMSRNREIRLRALRLAPLVVQNEQTRQALLDSMRDADSQVAAAAAEAFAHVRGEAGS